MRLETIGDAGRGGEKEAHDRNFFMSAEWIPNAEWRVIDRTIASLARKKGELEVDIGRWLLAAQRERVDRHCGYGSFTEYVERRLGWDARTCREKLRVARALENMPRMRALLERGERPWSAVREIVRVATPETEGHWIEKTERMTVRQVEHCLSGRKMGDLPSDDKDPLLVPRRMSFDLSPEDFALIEEAFEHVRQEIGAAAQKTEVLRAMAERVLGKRPERHASYQTSLTVCVSCERTWQKAGGTAVEVSAANSECARCDGEVIGFTEIDEGIVSTETAPVGRSSDTPQVAGGDLNETKARSSDHSLREWPADEAVLEENRLTNVLRSRSGTDQPPRQDRDDDEVERRTISARQLLRWASKMYGLPLKSMSPRLRSLVRARDRGRCVVPGCTNFRFVDLHHHQARKDGGPNTLENLYSLCTAHHRATHEGLLAIEGSPSNGLVIRHAGGVLYGDR